MISGLEGLPESTHDRRFGLDLECQSLPFQEVFVRSTFHVVASHPMPVALLADQPRGPPHLLLLERTDGSLLG